MRQAVVRGSDRRRTALCVGLLTALAATLLTPAFTSYPAPGDDEMLFADPAISFAHHGTLANPLLGQVLPGAARHELWQPPLYFWTLGSWMRVFGTTLLAARAFSALCALVIGLLVFALARRWVRAELATLGAAIALTSTWVVHAGRFVRMDALCVCLILASALAYIRWRDGGSRRLLAGAGGLAGLALLTHPLGLVASAAIALDLLAGRRRTRLRSGLLVAAPVVAALGIWTLYISADWHGFWTQITLQLQRKSNHTTVGVLGLLQVDARHGAALALALLATVAFAYHFRRDRVSRYFALLAMLTFIAAVAGGEASYVVYFFALMCVPVAALPRVFAQPPALRSAGLSGGFAQPPALRPAKLSRRLRLRAGLVLGLVLAVIASEVAQYVADLLNSHPRAGVDVALRATVPPGASVFLGPGAGRAYFTLQGRDRLGGWVPVPIDDWRQGRLAAHSQYVIVAQPVQYLSDVSAAVASMREVAHIRLNSQRSFDVYALVGPIDPRVAGRSARR